jgi:hypothetical protein
MKIKNTLMPLLVLSILFAGGAAWAGDPIPVDKSGRFRANQQLSDGDGHGFVLEQARWGSHSSFERVVLEFSNPLGDPAPFPSTRIETEFYPSRIAIRVTGAATMRKRLFDSSFPFQKSKLISRMNFYDTCRGGVYLDIVPARPVEYELFFLDDPARLVVDIQLSRMAAIGEQSRYSVRTFPLFGDQVCMLLDQAAREGITPRLITDSSGQVFAELALLDSPGDAFNERVRLEKLFGDSFAIVVKERRMMEVPVVLP